MRKTLPPKWVDQIFTRLHGRFGNVFFDKFRIGCFSEDGEDTGVANAKIARGKGFGELTGEDIGIANAKIIWGEELGELTGEDIARGLSAQFKFAPSCDEFRMACQPLVHADGRPTAIEAWAKLPKRESDTRLVTNEMDEAAEGLMQMIESRHSTDQASAKQIFIERYDAKVKSARERQVKAVWRVSVGTDSPRDAMANGLLLGVITPQYCLSIANPVEVDAAIETVKIKVKPENTAALALLNSPEFKLLAKPEETPEQREETPEQYEARKKEEASAREASKKKAASARDAILGMIKKMEIGND